MATMPPVGDPLECGICHLQESDMTQSGPSGINSNSQSGNGRNDATTSGVNNAATASTSRSHSDVVDPYNRLRYSDYRVQVCILGDVGVGKTSIIQRFTRGVFSADVPATVGSDMAFKTINLGEQSMTLNIWDTSGLEAYDSISQNYVRNAHGVILAYSYDKDKNSLGAISRWMQFVQCRGLERAVVMLVGNKCDLPADLRPQRPITTEQGERLGNRLSITFFETSARDNVNVDAMFQKLGMEIKQRIDGSELPYRQPGPIHWPSELQVVGQPQGTRGRKWKCCK